MRHQGESCSGVAIALKCTHVLSLAHRSFVPINTLSLMAAGLFSSGFCPRRTFVAEKARLSANASTSQRRKKKSGVETSVSFQASMMQSV